MGKVGVIVSILWVSLFGCSSEDSSGFKSKEGKYKEYLVDVLAVSDRLENIAGEVINLKPA